MLDKTMYVRKETGWYLPAGVGQAHELAMAVVASSGPDFPPGDSCASNTKTRSVARRHDYLVQLAVWSAKKDVSAGT